MAPTLVVVCGLPATGKTTVSRQAAGTLGAAHVRIDTIEHAIRNSASTADDRLHHAVAGGLGYQVAYAVARDLLDQGNDVIVDCVNPMKITRDAWQAVAESAGARLLEVELVCSDRTQHRDRATTRTADIPDLVQPTWQQIVDRDYEPWDRPHVVLDTADTPVAEAVEQLRAALRES